MQQHNFLCKIVLLGVGLMSSASPIKAELPTPRLAVPSLDERAQKALLGDNNRAANKAKMPKRGTEEAPYLFADIQNDLAKSFTNNSSATYAGLSDTKMQALIDVYAVTAYMKALIPTLEGVKVLTGSSGTNIYLTSMNTDAMDFYVNNDLILTGSQAINELAGTVDTIDNNYLDSSDVSSAISSATSNFQSSSDVTSAINSALSGYVQSSALAGLEDLVYANSNAILADSSAIDWLEDSLYGISALVVQNSNAIVVLQELAVCDSNAMLVASSAIESLKLLVEQLDTDLESLEEFVYADSNAMVAASSAIVNLAGTVDTIDNNYVDSSDVSTAINSALSSYVETSDLSGLENLVYANSNAILAGSSAIKWCRDDLESFATNGISSGLVDLIYSNSAAIVAESSAIVWLEDSLYGLTQLVIDNSNAIVASSNAIVEVNNELEALAALVYSDSNAMIAASSAIQTFDWMGQIDPGSVLNYNYWLSTNRTLAFDTATYGSVITGNNRIITVAQADYPLISPTCDINFTNVTFDGAYNGFVDTTAGTVTFDNGTELVLQQDIVLGENWNFAGQSTLNGNGHSITFGDAGFINVATGSMLTLKNVKLINNDDDKSILNLADTSSSAIMSNVIWNSDNHYAVRSVTRSEGSLLEIEGSMTINGKMSNDGNGNIVFADGSEFVLLEDIEFESSIVFNGNCLINGNGFNVTFDADNIFNVAVDSNLTLKNMNLVDIDGHPIDIANNSNVTLCLSNVTWNQLGDTYDFSGAGYVAIDGNTTFNSLFAGTDTNNDGSVKNKVLKNANWWLLDGATWVVNQGITLQFNGNTDDPVLYLGQNGNLFDEGSGSGTVELWGSVIDLKDGVNYTVLGGTVIVNEGSSVKGSGNLNFGDGSASNDVNLIFRSGGKFVVDSSVTISNLNQVRSPYPSPGDNFVEYWQYAYDLLSSDMPAADSDLMLTASINASQALEIAAFEPWSYTRVADVESLIELLTNKMLSNSNYITSISNAVVGLEAFAVADSNAMLAASSAIKSLQSFAVSDSNAMLAASSSIVEVKNELGLLEEFVYADSDAMVAASSAIALLADGFFGGVNGQLFDPSWTWSMAAAALQSYSIGLPSDYATDGSANDFKTTASEDAVIAFNAILESESTGDGYPRLMMGLDTPVLTPEGTLVPKNQYNIIQLLNHLAHQHAVDLQIIAGIHKDVQSLETRVTEASQAGTSHAAPSHQPGTTYVPKVDRPHRNKLS